MMSENFYGVVSIVNSSVGFSLKTQTICLQSIAHAQGLSQVVEASVLVVQTNVLLEPIEGEIVVVCV